MSRAEKSFFAQNNGRGKLKHVPLVKAKRSYCKENHGQRYRIKDEGDHDKPGIFEGVEKVKIIRE